MKYLFLSKSLPQSISPQASLAQSILLKGFDKKPVPLGIRKKSDMEKGSANTSFLISGIVTTSPFQKNQEYVMTIALNEKKINVKLGRLDDRLGINFAKQGILSDPFVIRKVEDIINLIKPNTQSLVEIQTKYKINKTIQCDEECQRSRSNLAKYGDALENVLLNPDRLKDGETLPISISQIVIVVM